MAMKSGLAYLIYPLAALYTCNTRILGKDLSILPIRRESNNDWMTHWSSFAQCYALIRVDTHDKVRSKSFGLSEGIHMSVMHEVEHSIHPYSNLRGASASDDVYRGEGKRYLGGRARATIATFEPAAQAPPSLKTYKEQ